MKLPTVQWITPGVYEGLPAQVNDLCPPKPEAAGARALSVPHAAGLVKLADWELVTETPGSIKPKRSGVSVGRKLPVPTSNRIEFSNTQA